MKDADKSTSYASVERRIERHIYDRTPHTSLAACFRAVPAQFSPFLWGAFSAFRLQFSDPDMQQCAILHLHRMAVGPVGNLEAIVLTGPNSLHGPYPIPDASAVGPPASVRHGYYGPGRGW